MTEGNGEVRELPEGWIQLKLENVADWGSGGTPSRKRLDYFNGDIPWIKTGELKSKYIRNTEEKITKKAINETSAKLFSKGSVAIAMYGATIGKTSILDVDASTNQACAVAKPLEEVLFNEFLYYYLCSQMRKFVEFGKGGAQPNISQNIIKNYLIPLPPLNEQERIVEKIEELFSDLDQGIESLKTAQKQLKVYRQAVLKWAFEGKLTEKWRSQIQQEKLDIQTGEELLAQIKTERENRYQQKLAEWEEAVREWEAIGKLGKKPTKPQKLKELSYLTKAELSELSRLPAEWCWVKIGDLTTGVEYGSAAKSKNEGRVPVLRMGNIQNYVFDWSDLVFSDDEQEIEKYLLKKGDVLFNRTNSPELVGKTAIYQDERPAIFAGYLIKINQINELVLSKYLNYFLNSITAKKHGNKVKTDGVNQSNINGDKLANYPFPYTLLREQDQIVQEIESRLSICDQLENTIIENLQKAEALRQSILKQAFEGKLVPQDPNDEPAEKLLERIKQEKIKVKKDKQLSIQGL